MPEVLFTPFYSANGMIPAHSLGLVPKNSERKTMPLAYASGFHLIPVRTWCFALRLTGAPRGQKKKISEQVLGLGLG